MWKYWCLLLARFLPFTQKQIIYHSHNMTFPLRHPFSSQQVFILQSLVYRDICSKIIFEYRNIWINISYISYEVNSINTRCMLPAFYEIFSLRFMKLCQRCVHKGQSSSMCGWFSVHSLIVFIRSTGARWDPALFPSSESTTLFIL